MKGAEHLFKLGLKGFLEKTVKFIKVLLISACFIHTKGKNPLLLPNSQMMVSSLEEPNSVSILHGRRTSLRNTCEHFCSLGCKGV